MFINQTLTALAAGWLLAGQASAANLLLTNSDLALPGSGGNWTIGSNFLGGVVPGPNDVVVLSNSVPSLAALNTLTNGGPYFAVIKGLAPDLGYTNAFDGSMPGTSIIGTDTIGGLWAPQTNAFTNWYLVNQAAEGAHNVYIGNQLNILSSTPRDMFHITSNTVAVGTGFDNTNVICYLTIQGPGSLNVTNPLGAMWVGQGSQTAGLASATHTAILDMSGLNTFNCVLSNIFTACDFNSANSATDPTLTGYARPQGCIFFALTNNITLLDTKFPSFIIGYENNNNGTSFCLTNCLGKVNYLNFDQMMIGGPKMSSSVGGLYFMPRNYAAANLPGSGVPALTDCYAKFRNIDGVSRQKAWILGDDLFSVGTTTTAYGNANFARGAVDALVDTIYCGRGASPLTNTPNFTTSTGTAIGTLTFGLGTTNVSNIDVNQLELGDMLNLTAPCQGTVTVYSNGVLNVNNYIRLINIPVGATSSLTSRGFLFVYGGLVNVSGNILNNGGPGGGFSQLFVQYGGTLDMQPNNSKPPGNISVATLQLAKGTIKNFGTLNVSNLVILPPNAAFGLATGETLSPGGAGYINTLNLGVTNTVPGSTTAQLDGTFVTNNGNGLVALSLSNSSLAMDIGTSSDKININGGLILSGVNQINVNPVAGFAPGTYTILTYNTNPGLLDCNGNPSYGITGNVATQLIAGGPITNSSYSVSFDASTPGVINMIIAPPVVSTSLTWVGDGSVNAWDVVGANNWNNGSGTSKFYQFDTVSFTDSGSSSPAVSLTGTVNPSSVNFSANQNYTVSGAGQIAGSASVNVTGSGTVNVLTTNTYSGGTTISSGTVRLGNGTTATGVLGAGTVSLSGKLAVDVPANQSQTIANGLTGSGVFTAEGPGQVVLTGTNASYTGSFVVTNGVLTAGALTAISSGWSPSGKLLFATNTGTLDIGGLAWSNYVTISGSGFGGIGALVNNNAAQANSIMQVFLAGDATVGGIARMDLNNSGTVPGGVTGNGFNLTKAGTNCISLYSVATSVFTNNIGNIALTTGVLRVQNGSLVSTNPAKTITVAANATLEVNNLWTNAQVIPTVALQNGSCLYGTGGTGVNVVSGYTNYQGNIIVGMVSLNGTDVIDVSTNSVLRINGTITGNGSLVKGIGFHPTSATTATSTGTGTLLLGASNNFTGDLVINAGTLILTNSGSVTTAPHITLAGGTLNATPRVDGALTIPLGQTLRGVGAVVGNLNVTSGAFLTPGNAVGLLTNVGNTVLSGTTTMTISKTNGLITSSLLGVSGNLQLGGTLNVVFVGTGLTNGDKFTLLSSPVISSNFSTINLPALATWSNNLTGDGSITVSGVNTEPTNAPTLSAVTGGSSSLTLSWPTSYFSYVLQTQTNTSPLGIGTNWVTVPTVNNSITIPIVPANGSVFYHLKK